MADFPTIKPAFGQAGHFVDGKRFARELESLDGRIVVQDTDPGEHRYLAGVWHKVFPLGPSGVFTAVREGMPGEILLRTDAAFSGIRVDGYIKKSPRSRKQPCYYTELTFPENRALHVNQIYVNEGLRGAGIGSALRAAIWRMADLRDADDITLTAGWTHGALSWSQAGAVLDAPRNREQYDANLEVLRKRIYALIEARLVDAQDATILQGAVAQADETMLQRVASVKTDVAAHIDRRIPGDARIGVLEDAFDPKDASRMTLSEAAAATRTADGKIPAAALLLAETYWPCVIRRQDAEAAQRYHRHGVLSGPV